MTHSITNHLASPLLLASLIVATASTAGCASRARGGLTTRASSAGASAPRQALPRGAVPGRQSAQALHKTVTRQVNYDYLLYLPKDFGQDASRRWPLVMFLHGAGERGSNVNDVKRHGPPKLAAAGEDFPFILVSPQCPKEQWWQSDDLQVLLDETLSRFPVDRERICLTGLSMGGAGTWEWVIRRPDLFAAAVPICGPTNSLRGDRFRSTPVWAFHGDKDPVVPVEASRKMVEAIRRAHGDARLTEYPGVGHDSWSRAYADPEMWRWLLSHRKTQDETVPTTTATTPAR